LFEEFNNTTSKVLSVLGREAMSGILKVTKKIRHKCTNAEKNAVTLSKSFCVSVLT
jgi:hypothetical protein